MTLVHPTIINKTSTLEILVKHLQDEPIIAVDTESNSLFAYYERVCLIQLSTARQDWVIDPLMMQDTDIEPLGLIFANPQIQKVFHAAEYDLMTMKRDFGFQFANLFDTMMAARILGLKAVGLGALLETNFDIQLDKRFQRADWSVRPIPPEQLRYAQMDTHYLLPLRDILYQALQEQNRLLEAQEAFAQMVEVPAAVHTFDPDGYWKIHEARDLDRRQYAILRELYLLREKFAKQRNRPPFKVMTDQVLIAIVLARPTSLEMLERVHGMSQSQLGRYGGQILQAVRQGERAPQPTRPDRTPRMEADLLARFDALQAWRRARALERGVESDVILSKEVMWALARSIPRSPDELASIPGLGPWKRATYGAELIGVLEKTV